MKGIRHLFFPALLASLPLPAATAAAGDTVRLHPEQAVFSTLAHGREEWRTGADQAGSGILSAERLADHPGRQAGRTRESYARFRLPETGPETIVAGAKLVIRPEQNSARWHASGIVLYAPGAAWEPETAARPEAEDAITMWHASDSGRERGMPAAEVDISRYIARATAEPGRLFTLVFRHGGGGERGWSVPLSDRERFYIALELIDLEKAPAVIVIPEEPLPALDANGRPNLDQADAAGRLRMLIERATGVAAPVVGADRAPAAGTRVFVGYGPHLEGMISPPEAPEGLKIVSSGGDLFLLGEIAPAGENNWPGPVDRGVMHAVETYAERVLGYRFLFSTPGDQEMFALGTVVPRHDGFRVEPGLLIEEAPHFAHRVAHGMPRGAIGLRAGGALDFNCNHVHDAAAWRRMYGEEHPELFVLKADGTRDWRHLDYAEPLVLEKDIEHLEAYFRSGGRERPGMARTPTGRYIMAEPTDNYPDSHSEAARRLLKPGAGWGRQSNLWFDYVRRLAAEVEQRWPHMRVSTLAYQWHYHPPDFPIPDNVDVMFTLMRSSTQNSQPAVFDHNLEMTGQWLERVGGDPGRLLLWEYWCWPGFFVTPPTVAPRSMQRWLRAARPLVSGVFINGGGHPQPFQYLMYRLWLRLLWDSDLDVEAEIADITGLFYGPAGPAMNDFYRLLIERFETEWHGATLIWGQYYATPDLYYGQSYTPEALARLAALLEQARRAAGLPAALETEARHGTAVYLRNIEAEPAPVTITLAAGDRALENPSAGWEGGRLSWRGKLEPGARLEITGPGRARLTAADGTASEAGESLEGAPPVLAPDEALVISFWAPGAGRDGRFGLELRYGPAGGAAEPDIYARRLAWLREPYLVFHPTWSSYALKTGFFAEAHTAHRHLGRVPACEAPEAETLPAGLDDPAWQKAPAAMLVRGCAENPLPFNNMGFPADLASEARFIYSREGLAVRLDAEGAPAEGETFALVINGKRFEFNAGPEDGERGAPVEFRADADRWSAMVTLRWTEELGLGEGETPVSRGNGRPGMRMKMPAQVERRRGDDRYLWSPPLGSPWGHHQQGPGELLFIPM